MAASPAGATTNDGGPSGLESRSCVRHAKRPTLIACGRCERPFCPECLVYTPAGQRCYECAGVRRTAAQRAVAGAALRALGIVAIGAAIGSAFGFLGALVAAAVGGSMAGQQLSPSVNRRSRRWMYLLSAAVLLAGALIGWSALPAARAMASGRLPVLVVIVAAALYGLQNAGFWLFVAIAAVAGYQRVR